MNYDLNDLVVPGWTPSGDSEVDRLNEMYYNPPQLRLEGNRVFLSGSSAFLNSQAGQSYKQELNNKLIGHDPNSPEIIQAIQAENGLLEQFSANSIATQQALIDLRQINPEATVDDLYNIGRAQVAGNRTNPSLSSDQIISGYDWDDEGNRIATYTTGAELMRKWNNWGRDQKVEEAQHLVSRANLGEISAIAELEFLRGGNETGFKNIPIGDWDSIIEAIDTGGINFLGSFTSNVLRFGGALSWAIDRPLAWIMGEENQIHNQFFGYANAIDHALATDATARGLVFPVSTAVGQITGQIAGTLTASILEYYSVSGLAGAAIGVIDNALYNAGIASKIVTIVGPQGYAAVAGNIRNIGTVTTVGSLEGAVPIVLGNVPVPISLLQKYPRFTTSLAKTMLQASYGMSKGARVLGELAKFGSFLGVDFVFNAERYLQASISNSLSEQNIMAPSGAVITNTEGSGIEQDGFTRSVAMGMLRDSLWYWGSRGIGQIRRYIIRNRQTGLTTQDFDNVWDDVRSRYDDTFESSRRAYARGDRSYTGTQNDWSGASSPPVSSVQNRLPARIVTINGNPIDNAGQVMTDVSFGQTFVPPEWGADMSVAPFAVTTADGSKIIRTAFNADNKPVIELLDPSTGAVLETQTFSDISEAESALSRLAEPLISSEQISNAIVAAPPNTVAPFNTETSGLSAEAGSAIYGGQRKYYIENKGVDYHVAYMSPMDYFKILMQDAGDGAYGNLEAIAARSDPAARTDANKYVSELRNGNAIDTPYVLYNADGTFDGQEGIHRVFAAMTLGYPKVPVMMRTPAKSLESFVAMQDGLPRQYFDNFNDATLFALETPGTQIFRVSEDAPPIAETPVSDAAWEQASPLDTLDDAITYLQSQKTPVAFTEALAKAMNTMGVARDSIADELAENGFSWQYAQDELTRASFEIDAGNIPVLDPTFAEINDRLIQPFFQKAAETYGYDWAMSPYAGYYFPQAVGIDIPVDLDDLLIDSARIDDSGFFRSRSGNMTTEESGARTTASLGNPIDSINSYWTSALTRGHKLDVMTNNQIAATKGAPGMEPRTDVEIREGVEEQYQLGSQIEVYKNGYKNIVNDELLADNDPDMSLKKREAERKKIWDQQNKWARDLNYVRRYATLSQTQLGYIPTNSIVRNINPGILGLNRANWAAGRSALEDIQFRWGKWDTIDGVRTFVSEVSQGNDLFRYIWKDNDAYVAATDIFSNYGQGGYSTLIDGVGDFVSTNMPWVSNPSFQIMKGINKLNSNMSADAQIDVITDMISSIALQGINSVLRRMDMETMNEQTEMVINRAMASIYLGSTIKKNELKNIVQTLTYAGALGGFPARVMALNPMELTRVIAKYGVRTTVLGLRKAVENWREYWNKIGEVSAYNHEFVPAPKNPFKNLPENATKTEVVSRAVSFMASFLTKPFDISEHAKNVLVYGVNSVVAERNHPDNLARQIQDTLRMYERDAVTGGDFTSIGINSNSHLMSTLMMFKGFSIRQLDNLFKDFTDAGYDGTFGGTGGGQVPPGEDRTGPNRRTQMAFLVKRLGLQTALWILFVSKMGMSLKDWLGYDPVGITDEPFGRGLYDDPETEEDEGMQWYDEVVNQMPLGPIFGLSQDIYFALRRNGFDSAAIAGDSRFQRLALRWLPAQSTVFRWSDMLNLQDRGYSVGATGSTQFSAPKTALDTLGGWLFGKWNTDGGRSYGRYVFGSVDPMNALLSGDFIEFAMSFPISILGDQIPGLYDFNTSGGNMDHVFTGEFEDRSRLAAAVVAFRKERDTILQERTDNLNNAFPRPGETQQQARERILADTESKIDAYTERVQDVVSAYLQRNPDGLTRAQTNTLMYLFDFDEGTDSTTSQFSDDWDSTYARERYVEAGLPDPNDIGVAPTLQTDASGIPLQNQSPLNYRDSIIATNAINGIYGAPARAAIDIRNALKSNDMDRIRKEYSTSINAIYEMARSNPNGRPNSEQYAEIEKQQRQYLATLEIRLGDLIDKYGMAILSSNAAVEELRPYLTGMVPYSTVVRGTSGNDVVWGTLKEWIQKRWGTGQPTIPSDQEVLESIDKIRRLVDNGDVPSAKRQARILRDKIARNQVMARSEDMRFLQSVLAR